MNVSVTSDIKSGKYHSFLSYWKALPKKSQHSTQNTSSQLPALPFVSIDETDITNYSPTSLLTFHQGFHKGNFLPKSTPDEMWYTAQTKKDIQTWAFDISAGRMSTSFSPLSHNETYTTNENGELVPTSDGVPFAVQQHNINNNTAVSNISFHYKSQKFFFKTSFAHNQINISTGLELWRGGHIVNHILRWQVPPDVYSTINTETFWQDLDDIQHWIMLVQLTDPGVRFVDLYDQNGKVLYRIDVLQSPIGRPAFVKGFKPDSDGNKHQKGTNINSNLNQYTNNHQKNNNTQNKMSARTANMVAHDHLPHLDRDDALNYMDKYIDNNTTDNDGDYDDDVQYEQDVIIHQPITPQEAQRRKLEEKNPHVSLFEPLLAYLSSSIEKIDLNKLTDVELQQYLSHVQHLTTQLPLSIQTDFKNSPIYQRLYDLVLQLPIPQFGFGPSDSGHDNNDNNEGTFSHSTNPNLNYSSSSFLSNPTTATTNTNTTDQLPNSTTTTTSKYLIADDQTPTISKMNHQSKSESDHGDDEMMIENDHFDENGNIIINTPKWTKIINNGDPFNMDDITDKQILSLPRSDTPYTWNPDPYYYTSYQLLLSTARLLQLPSLFRYINVYASLHYNYVPELSLATIKPTTRLLGGPNGRKKKKNSNNNNDDKIDSNSNNSNINQMNEFQFGEHRASLSFHMHTQNDRFHAIFVSSPIADTYSTRIAFSIPSTSSHTDSFTPEHPLSPEYSTIDKHPAQEMLIPDVYYLDEYDVSSYAKNNVLPSTQHIFGLQAMLYPSILPRGYNPNTIQNCINDVDEQNNNNNNNNNNKKLKPTFDEFVQQTRSSSTFSPLGILAKIDPTFRSWYNRKNIALGLEFQYAYIRPFQFDFGNFTENIAKTGDQCIDSIISLPQYTWFESSLSSSSSAAEQKSMSSSSSLGNNNDVNGEKMIRNTNEKVLLLSNPIQISSTTTSQSSDTLTTTTTTSTLSTNTNNNDNFKNDNNNNNNTNNHDTITINDASSLPSLSSSPSSIDKHCDLLTRLSKDSITSSNDRAKSRFFQDSLQSIKITGLDKYNKMMNLLPYFLSSTPSNTTNTISNTDNTAPHHVPTVQDVLNMNDDRIMGQNAVNHLPPSSSLSSLSPPNNNNNNTTLTTQSTSDITLPLPTTTTTSQSLSSTPNTFTPESTPTTPQSIVNNNINNNHNNSNNNNNTNPHHLSLATIYNLRKPIPYQQNLVLGVNANTNGILQAHTSVDLNKNITVSGCVQLDTSTTPTGAIRPLLPTPGVSFGLGVSYTSR